MSDSAPANAPSGVGTFLRLLLSYARSDHGRGWRGRRRDGRVAESRSHSHGHEPANNGWNGSERALKNNEHTRAIPVIALTALAMVGDREQALSAGCDDYDTKPVELPRLLEKMEALLKKGG